MSKTSHTPTVLALGWFYPPLWSLWGGSFTPLGGCIPPFWWFLSSPLGWGVVTFWGGADGPSLCEPGITVPEDRLPHVYMLWYVPKKRTVFVQKKPPIICTISYQTPPAHFFLTKKPPICTVLYQKNPVHLLPTPPPQLQTPPPNRRPISADFAGFFGTKSGVFWYIARGGGGGLYVRDGYMLCCM